MMVKHIKEKKIKQQKKEMKMRMVIDTVCLMLDNFYKQNDLVYYKKDEIVFVVLYTLYIYV